MALGRSQTAYPPPETRPDCALCLKTLSSFVQMQPSAPHLASPHALSPSLQGEFIYPGFSAASRWQAGRPQAKGKGIQQKPCCPVPPFRAGMTLRALRGLEWGTEGSPGLAAAKCGSGLVQTNQRLPPLALPSHRLGSTSDSVHPSGGPSLPSRQALTLSCRWSVQEPMTLYSAEPLRNWYW